MPAAGTALKLNNATTMLPCNVVLFQDLFLFAPLFDAFTLKQLWRDFHLSKEYSFRVGIFYLYASFELNFNENAVVLFYLFIFQAFSYKLKFYKLSLL